jgi:hypothetical protein
VPWSTLCRPDLVLNDPVRLAVLRLWPCTGGLVRVPGCDASVAKRCIADPRPPRNERVTASDRPGSAAHHFVLRRLRRDTACKAALIRASGRVGSKDPPRNRIGVGSAAGRASPRIVTSTTSVVSSSMPSPAEIASAPYRNHPLKTAGRKILAEHSGGAVDRYGLSWCCDNQAARSTESGRCQFHGSSAARSPIL